MTPEAVVAPPPTPIITSFPASIAVAATVIGSVVLLLVAARYDHTGGVLTISLLIILAFLGFIAFAMLVSVPNDQTTSAVIGALIGGVGAVLTFWLGKPPSPPPPPSAPKSTPLAPPSARTEAAKIKARKRQ